ncbi:polysaccharide deacetylase [Shewanella sp. Choline-02u-19]|uniref:polysaccharide deacetylase family protein n=1 Tax=Shewanella TaxID=22 RepID=UPI000C325501|nr:MULTISPECIES: polysaccharide deacetylase family protein [Shewanella]MCL1056733.1 polysaccharide deacetylase family protein [Shewanella gelidimarina]PKG56875.1 polysaccharide deacetylase [Shewanella sp. GutDb-MelDb]PKG74428.1 polysaccharide deacetylase [Shewanella sp. GutCb]PKH57746.1 polysaccharide deacetylase [Shewanella sp. Bg11-22]PKI29835.1 polysaccharide deacetylase [Shewanella sp. Choline-02u-19]
MNERRRFLVAGSAIAVGLSVSGASKAVIPSLAFSDAKDSGGSANQYWPKGERLVISISMQFEAGAQPLDAEGPFPPMAEGFQDTITPSWYAYGMKEGIPRLLRLWKKHDIKITSHMVGLAAERHPQLAKQVADEGHEISGHGQTWSPQFNMSPAEERASYEESVDTLKRITGQRPLGFNAFWMRHSPQTLEILQDLGFIYHIDDLSRDEPSVTPVNNKPFAVVPYTLRNNDIGRFGGNTAMTAAAFLQELKDEFDVLYQEGDQRRRMMAISVHDRIGGTPGLVNALDKFIHYAKGHANVGFMRKDAIAQWALKQTDTPMNEPR